MAFRKYDAGVVDRLANGDKGDCQVRALATAKGIPYWDAWHILYALQGELRYCQLPLVEALNKEEKRLGFVSKLSFPAKKGKPRMTGEKFCQIYTTKKYILRMSHHVAAVKNGVLYDTWDSSSKCVYNAWEIE